MPNTPSNQIYIASASIDGHVCVSSLVDPKDVTLRNFARPVQAVALSPDYKNDRSYLSGGLAGELILADAAGQLRPQTVPAPRGDYGGLFEAAYQTLRHGAPFPVREDELRWQLEILGQAADAWTVGNPG